jgi:adenylylsulfate kinase-like enzyme
VTLCKRERERVDVAAMTGVADAYEPPLVRVVRLVSVDRTVDENAQRVMGYLEEKGLL